MATKIQDGRPKADIHAQKIQDANNAVDLQTCLYIVENFVNKERCKINGSKSDVLKSNTPNVALNCWEICGQKISESDSTIHLGIKRTASDNIDTDNLVCHSRKTLYSLFGAGLHGKNGLNPPVSKHIWSTFVIPRLLYGIELMNMKAAHIQKLENYQQKTLKQLQWLPDRCANCAVYLLLGAEPIELLIDKKILILFGQISRDPKTLEYEIAQRQIAIHDIQSPSWFSLVRRTLFKYQLPSALELIQNPLTKAQWKKLVNRKTGNYWLKQLKDDKDSKTSLRYLSTNQCSFGEPHPIWKSVPPNPIDVQKAAIKARVLTGTYTLQTNRAKFNQFEVNPLCPLCKKEPEDRKHFLLVCTATKKARDRNIIKLLNFMTSIGFLIDQNNSELMLQLIIDCSALECLQHIDDNARNLIEKFSRDLIYDIHTTHISIMKDTFGSHI